MVLIDVDVSKAYDRDLLYVGASRATDRLVVLEVTDLAWPIQMTPVCEGAGSPVEVSR